MAKYLIGNIKGPKGDRGEAGPTYTAGTGIDITNNVISATGSGGITTETDPVFSASPAASITAQDITDWNNKSDFSGSYNDLTNKPDLSVYATTTALGTGLARKQDTLTAGTNISIDSNNVISAAAAEDELPTIASGDAGKVLTVNSGENGVEWTTPSGSATVVGYEADSNTKIRIGSGNSQTQAGYIIGLNNSVKSTGGVPVVIGKDNHTLSGAANSVVMGSGNYVSAGGVIVAGQSIELPNNFYGTTVVGRYNNKNELASQSYPFVVGTGTSYSNLKNGLILDSNANLTVLGKMTVGVAPTNDMDVATKKYVDDNAGGSGGTDIKVISIASTARTSFSTEDISYLWSLFNDENPYNKTKSIILNVNNWGEAYEYECYFKNPNANRYLIYFTKMINQLGIYGMGQLSPTILIYSFDANGNLIGGPQVSNEIDPMFIRIAAANNPSGSSNNLNNTMLYIKNNYATKAEVPSLPADPAADGTYFLSTTVSSGTATQSWVSIPAANGNNF